MEKSSEPPSGFLAPVSLKELSEAGLPTQFSGNKKKKTRNKRKKNSEKENARGKGKKPKGKKSQSLKLFTHTIPSHFRPISFVFNHVKAAESFVVSTSPDMRALALLCRHMSHCSSCREFLKYQKPRFPSATCEYAARHEIPFFKDLGVRYYVQRYRLFDRYDEGVQMDREGWFSVTPQDIAQHIAERTACDVVIDAFCGVGGNTIQFAKHSKHVIAIDNCPERLAMARHNCEVYGVRNVEFIAGDFRDVIKTLKADVVFLSPPWGGTSYDKNPVYHLEDIALGGEELFRLAREVTENVVYFLPKNTSVEETVALGGCDSVCELEYNYMDGKCKALTAYYGDTVQV